MVSGISGTEIAVVSGFVVRFARRQRTQSDGRQQLLPGRFEHCLPVARIQNRIRQRDGEDLIGADSGIVRFAAAFPAIGFPGIDHIEKTTGLLIPESVVE